MKLPESLWCGEIIIEPLEDIRPCKIMGEELTEVLEYQPSELYVKQYKRTKYGMPYNSKCEKNKLFSNSITKLKLGLVPSDRFKAYECCLPLVCPGKFT